MLLALVQSLLLDSRASGRVGVDPESSVKVKAWRAN